jgi:hypothetical protein
MLLTIVCEARDVPPRFAMTGAERWTSKKVEIKGAVPCANAVRMDGIFVYCYCVFSLST